MHALARVASARQTVAMVVRIVFAVVFVAVGVGFAFWGIRRLRGTRRRSDAPTWDRRGAQTSVAVGALLVLLGLGLAALRGLTGQRDGGS